MIDDQACIVQFALRVAQFYAHESCGKCTPCRVGTRWLVQLLRAFETGRATERDLELLLDVCDRIIGKCLCVLGDSAAMPVASCVTKFRDEFRAHLEHGGCPFGADSSLEGLFAPIDQHAHAPEADGVRMRHLLVSDTNFAIRRYAGESRAGRVPAGHGPVSDTVRGRVTEVSQKCHGRLTA